MALESYFQPINNRWWQLPLYLTTDIHPNVPHRKGAQGVVVVNVRPDYAWKYVVQSGLIEILSRISHRASPV